MTDNVPAERSASEPPVAAVERNTADVPGVPVQPGASTALAHRLCPHLIAVDTPERPITVDQTNYSVVVGESVVVKWLLPPVPEPYGAVDQLKHLAEIGFTEMPAFHGHHVVDGHVHAMVTAFLPGALDGWEWYVDDLIDGQLDAVIATAGAIGALAARLTNAFATPSATNLQPVADGSVRSEAERGDALLDEALAVTAGDAGERLRRRSGRIRCAIDDIASAGEVLTQWVHGDFHVGQLLRSGSTMWVNDFDGNPVASAGQRHVRRTPMVDLASMLQSIDHVGRIVVNRRPELAASVDQFLTRALAEAYDSYMRIRPVTAVEERLLPGLRAIQELHEFVYAARSLPRWLYVPDAALQAMFPED
jgi:maltokinase